MTFKFNPQIALRVTRPKYIGMIVPDVKLKCITKILFQEDKKKKKRLMFTPYSADKTHNNHDGM